MAGGKRKGAGAPKGSRNNPGLNDHPNTKAKQFGAENGNPQIQDSNCGYPTWSVRGAQRYFAAQPIDLDDTNALTNMLGRRKVSVAEAIALKQIRKALAGEDRAMETVTDNIEGKLEESFKYEAKRPPAPINPDEITTHEGLDDAHKQLINCE